MRVLFHIDDGARWRMALGNADNLLRYARETDTPCEIEIVANGPAVRELRADAARQAGLLEPLEALAPRLRVCACRNALRANGIGEDALPPFVHVVPAGVAELALRQQEGYAYIKP